MPPEEYHNHLQINEGGKKPSGYDTPNTEKFLQNKERVLSFKEKLQKSLKKRFLIPENLSAENLKNNPADEVFTPESTAESIQHTKNQYDRITSIFGESLLQNLKEINQNGAEKNSPKANLRNFLIQKNFVEKNPEEQLQIFSQYLLSLSYQERKELYLELKNNRIDEALNEENNGINSKKLDDDLITLNSTLIDAKLDNITLTKEDYTAIAQKISEAEAEKLEQYNQDEIDSSVLTPKEKEAIFTDYVYNKALTKEEQIFITTDSYTQTQSSYSPPLSAKDTDKERKDTDKNDEENSQKKEGVSEEEKEEIAAIATSLNSSLKEGETLPSIETKGKGYMWPLSSQSAIHINTDGTKEILLETGESMPLSGEITAKSIQKTNDTLVSRSIIGSLQLNKFFPHPQSKLRFVNMCMKKNETSLHQGIPSQYNSSNEILSPKATETRVRTVLRVITGINYAQNTKANDSQNTPENTIQKRFSELGILGNNGKVNEKSGYILFRHLKNFYDRHPQEKHQEFITAIQAETTSAEKSTLITTEKKSAERDENEITYSISSVSDKSISRKFQIRNGYIIGVPQKQ